MKNRTRILRMTFCAFFLALAYVLPFLTGQIPEIGAMLCPMHLPVLLCGFFCGPTAGLIVGATAPILRSLTLGMPPLFPSAICMAFELATYGAVAGILYKVLPRKKVYVYVSLLVAMIAGRLVWGAAMYICMGLSGTGFTLAAFMAGALTNAAVGIIAQIILVPILVIWLDKPSILGRMHESASPPAPARASSATDDARDERRM